ncbi:hypothetical protein [Serratia sp. Je.1.23.a]
MLSERCWQEPLVLHADNGAPMKSQVLQVTGRVEDHCVAQPSAGEQ